MNKRPKPQPPTPDPTPHPGWQQPPVDRVSRVGPVTCPHLGLMFAALTLSQHDPGHRWLCTCGQSFVVVTDGTKKRFEKEYR